MVILLADVGRYPILVFDWLHEGMRKGEDGQLMVEFDDGSN
ncbi:hypothetical protein [Methylophaga sp. UBA2513]|nr:hypothetical protein [Methylophaga sp. UBA2513]